MCHWNIGQRFLDNSRQTGSVQTLAQAQLPSLSSCPKQVHPGPKNMERPSGLTRAVFPFCSQMLGKCGVSGGFALSVLGWGQGTGQSSAEEAKGSCRLSKLPLGTPPHPRFRQQSEWAMLGELRVTTKPNDFTFLSSSGGGGERVQKRFPSQRQDETITLKGCWQMLSAEHVGLVTHLPPRPTVSRGVKIPQKLNMSCE